MTPEAAQHLRRLRARHGELMFHQSGGCCDGSSPMCFAAGEFITSEADEFLGDLEVPAHGSHAQEDDPAGGGGAEAFTVPVWMSKEQYALWAHTHLTIDVVPGRGAGFSLEAPDGVRFLIRSKLRSASTGGSTGGSAGRSTGGGPSGAGGEVPATGT